MMVRIIADQGRINIPIDVLDRAGIKQGSLVEIQEEDGALVLRKTEQGDPFEHVRGVLKLDRPTDEIIDELRGRR